MQASVENYQERSLEFYDLPIFSIVHTLYIPYFLTEFTNKITNLSRVLFSTTGYEALASVTLGANSTYKSTAEPAAESKCTDTTVPLIIDAEVLLVLGKNFQLGSNVDLPITSIKNVIRSVAATVYAADWVARTVYMIQHR